MKSISQSTWAFIVRIWIEHQELQHTEPIWRGVIEDMQGNPPIYFDNLEKMRSYFAQYLKNIGIDLENEDGEG